MTLTAPEIEKSAQLYWFCVRTSPKHEQLAACSLRQYARAEVFAPRIRFRKATLRGPIWFVEAMFPGYIFARLHYTEMHRRVRSLPGVLTLVSFGERIAVLDANAVDQIRIITGPDEQIIFNPEINEGDMVRIAQGPFMGLETVVTRLLPSKERVSVLLTFLGQEVEVEVPKEQVISIRAACDGNPDGSRSSEPDGELVSGLVGS